MKNDKIKIPRIDNAPQYAAEPEARRVCKRSPLCEGCPYPTSGFVCWHSDGSCMRTDVQNGATKIGDKSGSNSGV